MKLIEKLKTFAARMNILKGWKIKGRGGWKKTYEIFFVPTVKFNDWSATRHKIFEGETDHRAFAHVTDYCLSVAFLTAYYTISISKETPI